MNFKIRTLDLSSFFRLFSMIFCQRKKFVSFCNGTVQYNDDRKSPEITILKVKLDPRKTFSFVVQMIIYISEGSRKCI